MLCQFAHQFPPFIAEFLDKGRVLRRRFREETVTDLMMGSLVAYGGARVIVEFPDEPSTGADMEWNFANPDDGSFFRVLVQAKQAYGTGKVWSRHNYRELFHKSGAGKNLQATTLTKTAASATVPTYPLYAFYHRKQLCSLANASSGAKVEGVNLADGYLVQSLVAGATNQQKRTQNKSVGQIRQSLFSLSAIFCPATTRPLAPMALAPNSISVPVVLTFESGRPSLGFPLPPRPIDVRARLVEFRKIWLDESAQKIGADAIPSVPEVGQKIPDEIQQLIQTRGRVRERSKDTQNTWRVTFVSAGAPVGDDHSSAGQPT